MPAAIAIATAQGMFVSRLPPVIGQGVALADRRPKTKLFLSSKSIRVLQVPVLKGGKAMLRMDGSRVVGSGLDSNVIVSCLTRGFSDI